MLWQEKPETGATQRGDFALGTAKDQNEEITYLGTGVVAISGGRKRFGYLLGT